MNFFPADPLRQALGHSAAHWPAAAHTVGLRPEHVQLAQPHVPTGPATSDNPATGNSHPLPATLAFHVTQVEQMGGSSLLRGTVNLTVGQSQSGHGGQGGQGGQPAGVQEVEPSALSDQPGACEVLIAGQTTVAPGHTVRLGLPFDCLHFFNADGTRISP